MQSFLGLLKEENNSKDVIFNSHDEEVLKRLSPMKLDNIFIKLLKQIVKDKNNKQCDF